MAKCPVKNHEKDGLWRIKKRMGQKKIIICLACEWEWETESEKYDDLPMLTKDEIDKHLIGKFN